MNLHMAKDVAAHMFENMVLWGGFTISIVWYHMGGVLEGARVETRSREVGGGGGDGTFSVISWGS